MNNVSRRSYGRVSASNRPSLDEAARLHTSLGEDQLTKCPRCRNQSTPPEAKAGVSVFVCGSCGFKVVVERRWDRPDQD